MDFSVIWINRNYKEYNYSIKINNKTIPKNYKLLLINKIRNIKNMIKKW